MRPGDPESRDIEFVGDPAAGTGPDTDAEEELDTDRPRRSPRRIRIAGGRELRLDLVLGAAVLLLALLVARAATHGHPEPTPSSSAGASTSTGPSPSAASETPGEGSTLQLTLNPTSGRIEGPLLPSRVGINASSCPASHTCATSRSVAPDAQAAIRAVFPAAKITAARRVVVRDPAERNPLWYAETTARVGTGTLLVRVQAYTPGDADKGGARDDGTSTVTYVQTRVASSYLVYAQVTAPAGASQPFDQLDRLTNDLRLLATA